MWWGDISAPEYYMYIRDSKEILSLGSQKPQLCKYSLSSMTPMFISARDGEKILCYLTTPYRHDPGNGPPPMIAFPHGGPNARDDWGFNPIVQLLADRGIAVLNVNYRGSTGFGTIKCMCWQYIFIEERDLYKLEIKELFVKKWCGTLKTQCARCARED